MPKLTSQDEKLFDWNKIWYLGVFEVADYEFELNIKNSEWRIEYRGEKCKKVTWLE